MKISRFPVKEEFEALAARHNVVPLCSEILADTETPVSLLRKFYTGSGPVFLLESVEGGERWGRYSFLGTSARSHIRVFQRHVEVTSQGATQKIPHNRDPLKILKEISSGFNPAKVAGLPRFWGGLLGYMTYEMVSFFEKIPNWLPESTPLAHFIIPDALIIFDNIRNTMTAVAIAFMDGQTDPATAYREASRRIENMTAIMSRPLPAGNSADGSKSSMPQAELTPGKFMDMVEKVKTYIQAGDIIQAVISQPFTCPAPEDLWMLYRAQRYINPSPYLFFMHLADTALVGSSPETMVRLENRVATLRPIAGTRPRGESEKEDRLLADELLADEKERAEHLMLVDLGRNDLGRVANTGTVQVTDLMFVERYSHVMHLVSNITCDLKPEMDAWDLIRATFPAGTLSGAPKVRAMEIIAELENVPRGPYGGAVGYISFGGNMDLAITIRTACVESGKLTIRAGAGIVADSNPEKEHQESVNKAMAIQKALEMIK
ncbi:MAG: anthranilate synthase component I [Desulfobacterales bacterium]|nr:anthranilate synthase component I [Desulfobacterales bacterium]